MSKDIVLKDQKSSQAPLNVHLKRNQCTCSQHCFVNPQMENLAAYKYMNQLFHLSFLINESAPTMTWNSLIQLHSLIPMQNICHKLFPKYTEVLHVYDNTD